LREEQILPYQTTSLTGATVLVLAPHPDDETIGCGGALALHRAHGDPVKVLVLTDGARAEGPDARGADYIALREREARAALAVLRIEEVEFWRLPDRSLTVEPATVARLVAVLQEYRPTLLYLPSPLEPHPDHAVAAQLVWAALRVALTPVTLCLYEVGLPIRPNILVDITPVLSQKERALACYASQLKLNDYRSKILGLNRYRSYTLPAEVTHAEAFWRLASEEACAASLELVRWQMAREGERAALPHLPLVSIIVRTFNRPRLLREALQSILAQSYRNFEVVAVNDGGEDVEPVLAEFRPFLQITALNHEKPAGRPQALNAGLRQAKGEFIAYLDDDDVYYPDHVETLVNFLRSGNYRVAYTDVRWAYQRIDPANGEYQTYETRQEFSKDFDPDWLLFENYIPINAVMHSRKVIEEVGPFDEEFQLLEDWELWLRMSQEHRFQRLRTCTAEYRIREYATNVTFAPAKKRLMDAYAARLFAKYADRRNKAMQRLFEDLRKELALREAAIRSIDAPQSARVREVEEELKKARDDYRRLRVDAGDYQYHLDQELAKYREHQQHLEQELAKYRDHQQHLEQELRKSREQLEVIRAHIAQLEAERDTYTRSIPYRFSKILRDTLP
jgi:LmbE family N-acetylglucosaminyl deacetylase/glycosyltransferase involved in cell wall biosynthesis